MQEARNRDPAGEELLDVVVVGGSQAGLAMAWHLARQGLRFVVLEAGARLGHVWRSRWDSLKLFTPAQYDALPGLPFPGPADSYPTKDPVADYLEAYANAFHLPVRLNARVIDLRRTEEGVFEARTADQTYRARQVVAATGPFQVPFVPAAARKLDESVTQLHSFGYRNPEPLPDGPVLVVGGGNSGFQIAEELAATRQVDLSIGTRNPKLPRRLAGKDLFWWLTRLGLMRVTASSRLGRRIQARGEFVIGGNRRRLERAGVRIRPRAVDAEGRTVRFADGSTLDVGVVIWGNRLPCRLLLGPYSGCGGGQPGGPPARRHRRARPVLPRPDLAAHPRVGAARLRQGRRRLPRRPHHGVPAAGGAHRHRRGAAAMTGARTFTPIQLSVPSRSGGG
jgi:putative flavoprotein involved in K+ transport